MRHRYRHTQIGWAIIIAVIAAAAVAVPAIQAISAGPMPAAFLAVLLSLMALFATLTVVVDDTHLGFRFTLGLIGKRIALADIRHYRAVRNPWYYGWGIHLYPGGVLYNVSGLQAVEILLKGGRRLRIGTDEPDAVVRAIEGVIGAPEPLSPQEEARVQSWTKKWRTVLLGILFLVLAGIGLLAYFEEQPPKVTVTDVSFKVRGVLYGEQFPMAEITGVSLCQRIPRILARTNGYAGGRTLRGHFRLAQLGDGQLFIRLGVPPYLLVRTQAQYVIVNFRDPARTQEVYEELTERLPGTVVGCLQDRHLPGRASPKFGTVRRGA